MYVINCISVTTVQCGTPGDVLDSTPVEDLKQTYNVGEEVTYKCNTGTEKEIRRCQPDGTWSMIGFVCGRKCLFYFLDIHVSYILAYIHSIFMYSLG